MIYLTFEEWNRIGCRIRRGEKSHKRNEKGVALFSENQIIPDDASDEEYDWERDFWSEAENW